jgi:hydrolase, TatD family
LLMKEIVKPMIFESHAHYDDEAFDEDRQAVLMSMREGSVSHIVNVAASVNSLKSTKALMEQYPFVYGAVGIHPDDVGDLDNEVLAQIQKLCKHEKTVAVGEIGLDYYWDKEQHDLQKYWFERQLEVAREEQLPFIMHSRDAAADTLDMAKGLKAGDIGGIVHCFSYGVDIAREYLNMGIYLGIGGVVTFNNGKKLKEVVEYAPLDHLLLETDCPYLAPVPYRGKRNTSLLIPQIAEEIARIKGVSYEEVVTTTHANAMKVFKL